MAAEKERAFRCPRCALTAYPRISPAIITLVRKGDEAVLANSARFPIPFFSTLAGFSEVGESLEQTLVEVSDAPPSALREAKKDWADLEAAWPEDEYSVGSLPSQGRSMTAKREWA